MRFNEDSRVKIPAILHLARLGYTYLSLKNLDWDDIVCESEFPFIMLTPQVTFYRISDREKLDNRFLAVSFNTGNFQHALKEVSGGGTRASIGITQQKNLSITLPPETREQTKIGGYFKELDRLIELHQRKHGKLVTLKKAMLQKMFPQPGATTPEIRFKGFSEEWVEKPLGEIANVYQPQTISQRELTTTGFNVYGANGIVGKYLRYNHKEPQIAVTCRGNTCGTVNFTKEKSWITGNAMVVNTDKNELITKPFLFQQLSSQDLNYLITGSGQPQITGTIKLHKTWICLPAEQQKIGTYFRTHDELISKHAIHLQKLKQIKSACLEKMFV